MCHSSSLDAVVAISFYSSLLCGYCQLWLAVEIVAGSSSSNKSGIITIQHNICGGCIGYTSVYKLSVNRRPPFNRRPYNPTNTVPDRCCCCSCCGCVFFSGEFFLHSKTNDHHLAPSIYRSFVCPYSWLLLSLPNEVECNLFCEIA